MTASISATSASLGPTWRGTKLSAGVMVVPLVVVDMQASGARRAPVIRQNVGRRPQSYLSSRRDVPRDPSL
jgi:hypothetical protein